MCAVIKVMTYAILWLCRFSPVTHARQAHHRAVRYTVRLMQNSGTDLAITWWTCGDTITILFPVLHKPQFHLN
jgi:hypothetical protein